MMLIEKTIRECVEIMHKTAKENFKQDSDKLNFVMTCTVNLCGNMCANNTIGGSKELKQTSIIMLENLNEWFLEKIKALELHEKLH